MKYLFASIFISSFLFLSSCGTMMVLLGDNVRYSMIGNIKDSQSGENIQAVSVSIDCPGVEKSMYQDRKGLSDINGSYILSGYWELNECTIEFSHDGYKTKSILIADKYLTDSQGLIKEYEINIKLDQNE